MSLYSDKCAYVGNQVWQDATNIFNVYGNELILRLEEYNLLTHPNNCLESSTAPGFIIEEFLSSKLEIFTNARAQNNLTTPAKQNNFIIQRAIGATSFSYDCFCNYGDTLFMINIKAEKSGSNNNAVAAINRLYTDYCCNEPKQEKAFLVLKIHYSYGSSANKPTGSNGRCILIDKIESYFLEEIDFSVGHKQDHRNWSINNNLNSGRLQITRKTLKENRLNFNDISYGKTFDFIKNIFLNNQKI